MSKEAMKLALGDLQAGRVGNAMQILREALAEQPAQQEPVAWRYDLKRGGSFEGVSTEYSRVKLSIGENWTPLYTSPPAQQKPVAVVQALPMGHGQTDMHYAECQSLPVGTLLYTAPPAQRKPLTRQQINQMMADAGWQNSAIRQADLDKVEKVVRAIEAAHGIKENT